jgi:actin related protein 2/3 complex subunit 2
LKPQNTIIQNTLTDKFSAANIAKPTPIDVQFVDYDGVRFHLSTPESKSILVLSMHLRCWDELVKYGAQSVIQREYGQWLAPGVEHDYNVSLQFDLSRLPPEGGERISKYAKFYTKDGALDERQSLIQSAALLKRNTLAGPFEQAFQEQQKLESVPTPTDGSPAPIGDLMQIHYRDEEAIYIQAAPDRVTVIFSTIFREEVDRIYGKVFLQV